MEPLQPFDPQVLALGRRLVDSLSERGGSDILSSWMAHHIAGLISTVETAVTEQDRAEAATACTAAILKLWDHRNTMPNGARPFAEAESALFFLRRLDPYVNENLYFRMREEVQLPGVAGDWIRMADAVDGAARVLVRFCLEQAYSGNAAELKRWVSLAPGIDPANQAADVALVAALTGRTLDDSDKQPDESEGRLRDRLEVLTTALQALHTTLGDRRSSGEDSEQATS